MKIKTKMRFWGILVFLLLFSNHANCQQSKFHAIFLTKFSENVRWPNNINQYVIGVIGESPVYEHLEGFTKIKTNIKVIKVQSASEVDQCHILYLPNNESKNIDGYANAIGTQSILLVSESDRLVGDGADIGFYLEDGKLKFLVGKAAMDSKSLIMGSNLLGRGKIQ